MQISLWWDDEHAVGRKVQPFGNQFDRHVGVTGKDFVEESIDCSQVIDDDARHIHVRRKVPQQSDIGVKTAGRPAHSDDREVFRS